MNIARKTLIVSLIFAGHAAVCGDVAAGDLDTGREAVALTVTTYDGLQLPGQVIRGDLDKKLILFVNGSTPYDEKGHIGAFMNERGEIVAEKHDFYLRLLDILSRKGYPIATLAKRSFVYPARIPRPSFHDLAMDIVLFMGHLKQSGLVEDESDIVIVGYSEGSIVASKVLGILKRQPHACILLGSGSSAWNYRRPSIDDFDLADVLRRKKQWNDEQIEKEMSQLAQISTALSEMDEDQFEAAYKRSKPFGFGFADWESYYIDKESSLYEPTANLMCANIPVLICVGEDDVAMPLARARRTYQALLGRGFEKATFRVIGEEVHQYLRYDVFAIIDTWLRTDCRSTDFELTDQDLAIIEEYRKGGELASRVGELPWKDGDPAAVKECYAAAAQARTVAAETWFELGLKLIAVDLPGEAAEAFSRATDPSFVISFASHAWMGVIADGRGERNAAVDHYRAALEAYPDFPIQHDQWNLTIDRDWLNDRLKTPFEGLQK